MPNSRNYRLVAASVNADAAPLADCHDLLTIASLHLRGIQCYSEIYRHRRFLGVNDSWIVTFKSAWCRCRARPSLNRIWNAPSRTSATRPARGAELICLPELFQTQYFCQREDVALFDLAEPIPGPATKRLGDLARELNITIIASLFERRAPGIYHNTAAILDTGGKLAGIYRKMHIPDDPLYYEKFYFTPGDLGFKSFHN